MRVGAILTNLILSSESSEFLDGLQVGGEEESRVTPFFCWGTKGRMELPSTET